MRDLYIPSSMSEMSTSKAVAGRDTATVFVRDRHRYCGWNGDWDDARRTAGRAAVLGGECAPDADDGGGLVLLQQNKKLQGDAGGVAGRRRREHAAGAGWSWVGGDGGAMGTRGLGPSQANLCRRCDRGRVRCCM